jgi:hypothetical protein
MFNPSSLDSLIHYITPGDLDKPLKLWDTLWQWPHTKYYASQQTIAAQLFCEPALGEPYRGFPIKFRVWGPIKNSRLVKKIK